MKIGKDKFKHLIVGGLLAILLMPPTSIYKIFFDFEYPALVGYGACAFIAIGWEIYQRESGRGHYELMDFVFTVIFPTISLFLSLL